LLHRAGTLGLIDATRAEQVSKVYRELRLIQHNMRLNIEGPCRVPPESVEVAPVLGLWGDVLEQR
jgi:hypothetical protein